MTDPSLFSSRSRCVARATRLWIDQLTDLSGRNNLLYYKDRKRGTLDLDTAEAEPQERLLAGKTVRLSRLFPDAERRTDAVRRAQAIHKKIREFDEERGINTGYVVSGIATWREERKIPAAPILLRAMSLVPLNAARDDFELTLDDEVDVNPVLLYKLRSDFRLELAAESLGDPFERVGVFEPATVFDRMRKLVGDHVPDFDVTARLVAGTFTFAKQPMVEDLRAASELLESSDLVAAIAGDEEALRKINHQETSKVDLPVDSVPPKSEFVILDADSSQSQAINAVRAGQNLVIQGPPGTGKSQTIANLVATLVADGRRVLFVAEKRAALDAVLRRLHDRDLAHLVLDIHQGVKHRRRIAEELDTALSRARVTLPSDVGGLHRQLAQRRHQLNEHRSLLHQPHPPWNVTIFEAQAGFLGVPERSRSAVRLHGDVLIALGGEVAERVRDDLRRYANLSGFAMTPDDTPWSDARIYDPEHAQSALELVARLRTRKLPAALAHLREATAETGLPYPKTLAQWGALYALYAGTVNTLNLFSPDVYGADLGDLVAATGSRVQRRDRGVTSNWSTRRRLRRRARDLWRGGKVKRTALHAALHEAERQREAWRELGGHGMPRPSTQFGSASASLTDLMDDVMELGRFLPSGVSDRLSLQKLQDTVAALHSDSKTPWRLPEIYDLRRRLGGAGLSPLIAELADRRATAREAVETFDSVWYGSILDYVRLRDSRYAAFSGSDLRDAVADFQHSDLEHIDRNTDRVRRRVAERLRDIQDERQHQASSIRREAKKRSKHRPLRKLLREAPDVLFALKPCWAISPLVVSQVLPAERLFDVVIFDEASQIHQPDAIPSIMRADQIVVAGDTKQLPPTDFFAELAGSDSDDEEEPAAAGAYTEGFGSILETLAAALPEVQLTWHYRSRDERLITFSNEHFYGRSLTTFPGIFTDGSLNHVVVTQPPMTAGQEESVAAEVDKVVDLMLEHARTRPDESLGVITMGIKHTRRIERKLEAVLRAQNSAELEKFFGEGGKEPYFIKNLERVQGDERDAIILSVGYGKTADGRMQYRWGPLLREGGERRLNVAITRAKRRLMLVTSFETHDVDPSRVHHEGAKLLGAYLKYVDSGGGEVGTSVTEPALNPFEIDVRDRLRAAGVPVIPQYGVGGFRVDFAAQHPHRRGQMVLAIEADGASYHSADTARDRDRLRQEHLERLGWRFHRIWSTDWFLDPNTELAKIRAAYDQAVALADTEREGALSAATVPSRPRSKMAEPQHAQPDRGPRPAALSGVPITEYDMRDLVRLARWIESDGLLRTEGEVMGEMMEILGFKKRGSRIVDKLSRAISIARRSS